MKVEKREVSGKEKKRSVRVFFKGRTAFERRNLEGMCRPASQKEWKRKAVLREDLRPPRENPASQGGRGISTGEETYIKSNRKGDRVVNSQKVCGCTPSTIGLGQDRAVITERGKRKRKGQPSSRWRNKDRKKGTEEITVKRGSAPS